VSERLILINPLASREGKVQNRREMMRNSVSRQRAVVAVSLRTHAKCEAAMRRVLAVCFSLCIALLSEQSLAASALQDGLSAYDRGDYGEAVRLLRPLAEEGDPGARNVLGRMYELGLGVEPDLKEAVRWFALAAKSGDPQGQNNLAVMYSLGQGVQRNQKTALRWYRRAAGRGHAVAQYNLGVIYEEGWGVRKDYVRAARWYRLAEAQDLEPARHNLAMMYSFGQGVGKNQAKAVELLQRAAAHGYAPAQSDLGMMYFNGLGVAKDVVVAHLWFALAAEQGSVPALLNLLLIEEEMTPEQIAEAKGLFRAWKGQDGTSRRDGLPIGPGVHDKRIPARGFSQRF
jgi:TPR repeat protein